MHYKNLKLTENTDLILKTLAFLNYIIDSYRK